MANSFKIQLLINSFPFDLSVINYFFLFFLFFLITTQKVIKPVDKIIPPRIDKLIVRVRLGQLVGKFGWFGSELSFSFGLSGWIGELYPCNSFSLILRLRQSPL